jgi:hypothetical protein
MPLELHRSPWTRASLKTNASHLSSFAKARLFKMHDA